MKIYSTHPRSINEENILAFVNDYTTIDNTTQLIAGSGDLLDMNCYDEALYYIKKRNALSPDFEDVLLKPSAKAIRAILSRRVLFFNDNDLDILEKSMDSCEFYADFAEKVKASSEYQAVLQAEPIGMSYANKSYYHTYYYRSDLDDVSASTHRLKHSTRSTIDLNTYHVALIARQPQVLKNVLENKDEIKNIDSSKAREALISKILNDSNSVDVYDASNNAIVEFTFDAEELKIKQSKVTPLVEYLVNLV